MYKKIILPFIFFSAFTNSINAQVLNEQELKLIQSKVDEQLKNPNLSEEKKLLLTMTAAKEAFQFHFYDVAIKYYQIAIDSKSDENKTEAYINQLAISLSKNDKVKIASQFSDLKNYLDKNPKFRTKEIEYYIKTLDASLSHNETPANISGFYGQYATEEQFKNLFNDKKYDKAMAFINPNALKNTTDSFSIISYDSLNVLINKKKVKNLYCSEELKKYPDAYAYGPLICQLLTDYIKTGKMKKDNLARTEKYFKSHSSDLKFIFEAVKEIK